MDTHHGHGGRGTSNLNFGFIFVAHKCACSKCKSKHNAGRKFERVHAIYFTSFAFNVFINADNNRSNGNSNSCREFTTRHAISNNAT